MDFEIRELAAMAEFREHERLQQVIWGSDAIDVPANLLAAGARHGAVVLGAYSGGEIIGILYGFPALTSGVVHHHSHMLGVLPPYRRHGIGLALKLRQADLVRAQGLDLITWTVDPLEVGNNLFNFSALGVVCDTYLIDAYGEMDDSLNRGLPSDRLEVEWRLDTRDDTTTAAPPRPTEPVDGDLTGSIEAGPDGLAQPSRHPATGSDMALVEAPLDSRAIKQANPALALRWRLHLRELFTDLFGRGYTLVDCVRRDDRGCYVFRRQSQTAEDSHAEA